jgi:putative membrane protein
VTEVSVPEANAGEPVDDWRHFHPLSPLVKGGIALLAVIGYVLSQQTDRILGQSPDDPTAGHPGIVAAGVGVVLVAIVVGAWVSWRFAKFRLTDSLVEVRSGVVFRQHRQVRYDRIQAVDISRPILARLTGLSEVVVQSAGGRESHLKLSFLGQEDALRLRDRLASLSAQGVPRAVARTGEPGVDGLPADRIPIGPVAAGVALPDVVAPVEVVRVPTARVVQSWLWSPATLVFAVGAVMALVGFLTGTSELIGTSAPFVIGVGSQKFRQLVGALNFVLEQTPAALRVRHGLTELRATTIPLHRIQAVEVVQPLFWRPVGWWLVRVNVAGVGVGEHEEAEGQLLPVGTLDEALRIVRLAVGGTDESLLRRAALGTGADGGYTTAPEGARLLDPIAWRRRGYAVTPSHLVIRTGSVARSVQVVPHARVQSLTLEQGPVQRSREVASVRVVSTPGAVDPRVHHLALAEAERLVEEQRTRSTAARSRG